MKTTAHRHRANHSRDVPWMFPAGDDRRAHGNITTIDTCSCGAERRTDINQQHVSRGPWVTAATTTETRRC